MPTPLCTRLLICCCPPALVMWKSTQPISTTSKPPEHPWVRNWLELIAVTCVQPGQPWSSPSLQLGFTTSSFCALACDVMKSAATPITRQTHLEFMVHPPKLTCRAHSRAATRPVPPAAAPRAVHADSRPPR